MADTCEAYMRAHLGRVCLCPSVLGVRRCKLEVDGSLMMLFLCLRAFFIIVLFFQLKESVFEFGS